MVVTKCLWSSVVWQKGIERCSSDDLSFSPGVSPKAKALRQGEKC